MSNDFKPAIADPNRLTDPFLARGAPKDPIPVRQDPGKPDYHHPATAKPEQVSNNIPANAPGRGRPTLPGGSR
jgi:hypothetical protein